MTDVIPDRTRQQQSYLEDDFMVTARPWGFEQFWNASTSPTLIRLAREARAGLFSKVSVHVGPAGSGKTSGAKVRGMITNCEVLECTPKSQWHTLTSVPCGRCGGCQSVHIREGWERRAYKELNGATTSSDEIEEALSDKWSRKTYGSTELPRVLVIDEAASLGSSAMAALHKCVEETKHYSFILIVREAERGVTLPMSDRTKYSSYRFTLPTAEQAAQGLLQVARVAGMVLHPDAARLIPHLVGNMPRSCLSVLNQARAYGSNVTPQMIEALLDAVEGSDTGVKFIT